MMWDFSGSSSGNTQYPYPPATQMPGPSFPTPQPQGSSAGPYPAPGRTPSPYPPFVGGMAPTYIPAPQYERTIYYGHPGVPAPLPSPLGTGGAHPPGYAYESYTGTFDIPQPEHYERPRAHSHAHAPAGHAHVRSQSYPPPQPASILKASTPQPQPQASSHSHAHRKQHKPPPPPLPAAAPSYAVVHAHAHKPKPKPKPALPVDPLNPNFQYSRCTGRKKALCIGINYKGQPNELRGCINDARHVRDFLIKHHGYRPGDIVLLSDDAKQARALPTRRNILDAMKWLVRSARADDSLFFHYSGHGGQTKDLSGDEVDGWDEVIFPMDFKQNGHIIDDDMHTIMVKPLPAGCRLTALFDSCHSGTVLDLPYIYSSHGRLKGSHVSDRVRKKLATPADVISWSGCKDGQTSADTFAGGVAVGAMSYAFMTSLTRNPKQTYQELLRSIRLILHPRFSQKPQLGSSHHIDTSLRFVI